VPVAAAGSAAPPAAASPTVSRSSSAATNSATDTSKTANPFSFGDSTNDPFANPFEFKTGNSQSDLFNAPLVEDDPFKFDFNESDPLKFPPQSAQVNYPHLDTRETFTIDLTKNPFGDDPSFSNASFDFGSPAAAGASGF